jgi:hypothetical protein
MPNPSSSPRGAAWLQGMAQAGASAEPGPSFRQCECGATVCYRVWHMHTKDTAGSWEALPQPLSPVLGTVHVCAASAGEARAA